MPILKNILLIDDDEVTNFINAEIIESLEITNHVDICYNGSEALNFLDLANAGEDGKIIPDLVFLDINMPVMDGFEFLKEYKNKKYGEDKESIIITMLTTSLRTEDMERAQYFNDIVNGYIEKPLTKTVVLNVIKKYFERERQP